MLLILLCLSSSFLLEFLGRVRVSCLSSSFLLEFESLVSISCSSLSLLFKFEFRARVRVSCSSSSLDQCRFTYRHRSRTLFIYAHFGGKLRPGPVSKSTLVYTLDIGCTHFAEILTFFT